jgi:transcriptional regulator with XRE-family HTH domain
MEIERIDGEGARVFVGRALREVRTARGLSQPTFYEAGGRDRASGSRWEAGINTPDLDILDGLMDTHGFKLQIRFVSKDAPAPKKAKRAVKAPKSEV